LEAQEVTAVVVQEVEVEAQELLEGVEETEVMVS